MARIRIVGHDEPPVLVGKSSGRVQVAPCRALAPAPGRDPAKGAMERKGRLPISKHGALVHGVEGARMLRSGAPADAARQRLANPG